MGAAPRRAAPPRTAAVGTPSPDRALSHTVFVTGGTGYLGRPLIADLIARGHRVRALVRPGSEHRLPIGEPVEPVIGDALRAHTFTGAVHPADTLVHLVGTPRPGPGKAAQF
ncbi:MAG: NAD-dependent epimerase/dehydratase family protein, partial [Thermoleophilaceae bacterium]